MTYRISTVSGPFGPVSLIWSMAGYSPRIDRIFLSSGGAPAPAKASRAFPHARPGSCPRIDIITESITVFLRGGNIRFSLGDIRLEACSEFRRRVLTAEHAIPRGRVSSYGRIAGYLGSPGAARAVGNCLAVNPFPIIIPCHRAIRSDRTLGGYQGGTETKRALLEMEGIRFDASGRAEVKEFHY